MNKRTQNLGRWGLRFLELVTVAAVVFGVADLVFSWNPLAALPYATHRQLPVFRPEPWLWLGVIAESVNGWIVTLAYLALRRADTASAEPRRARDVGWRLGLMAWGFWVVSGTFTTTVWLAVPWTLAVSNVIFGLPKCFAIAYAVAAYGQWRLPPWPGARDVRLNAGGAE